MTHIGKAELRHFTTFTKKAVVVPSRTDSQIHNTTAGSDLFYSLTSSQDIALTRLALLATLQDRSIADDLLLALRDYMLPGWRLASCTNPLCGVLYKAFVEAPCFGVPGLTSYLAARASFVQSEVAAAIASGIDQVVLLFPGYETLAHRLASPAVTFYEIDSKETSCRKRDALAKCGNFPHKPSGTAHSLPAPRYVVVERSSLCALVPALTAAGFEPQRRSVFVMTGTVYYLPQAAVDSLLSDVAALAAPGSPVCLDVLSQDALDSASACEPPPGYTTLAKAVANKGSPFLSGLRPQFSALVKLLSLHDFRVATYLPTDKQPLPGHLGPWGSGRGPLPPFFTLVSAVKATPRLLLRHAPVGSRPEAGLLAEEDSGGLEPAAGSCSARTAGGSCFIGSLLGLLFGAWGGNAPVEPQPQQQEKERSPPEGRQAALPALLVPPTLPGGPLFSGGTLGGNAPSSSQPGTALCWVTGDPGTTLAGEQEQHAVPWTLKAAAGSVVARQAQGKGEAEEGLSQSSSAVSIRGQASSGAGAGKEGDEAGGGSSAFWSQIAFF